MLFLVFTMSWERAN